MEHLQEYCEAHGQPTVVSNWNDTAEVYNLMMYLNTTGDLTTEMRCIFGAAELAARYHYLILPALQDGKLVLVNKYLVSAFAHALIRGHERKFLSRVYQFALKPDFTIYCDLPPQVALERKGTTGSIGFWEAGLDLAMDVPLEESLRLYQTGGVSAEFLAQNFVKFQTRLRQLHQELLQGTNVLYLDGVLPKETMLKMAIESLERVRAEKLGGALPEPQEASVP